MVGTPQDPAVIPAALSPLPHGAGGEAAALHLLSDATHGFASSLIFQVENLVKTKN